MRIVAGIVFTFLLSTQLFAQQLAFNEVRPSVGMDKLSGMYNATTSIRNCSTFAQQCFGGLVFQITKGPNNTYYFQAGNKHDLESKALADAGKMHFNHIVGWTGNQPPYPVRIEGSSIIIESRYSTVTFTITRDGKLGNGWLHNNIYKYDEDLEVRSQVNQMSQR